MNEIIDVRMQYLSAALRNNSDTQAVVAISCTDLIMLVYNIIRIS